MSTGWRKGFADVVAAIQGTLADAANAGSMSAAEFLKLAGLPTSAVPTARLVNTTAPLTGGGDLSGDRTLAISAASGVAAGSMSAADFAKLATAPTGSGLPQFFRSAVIDFTVTSSGNVIVPAVVGKFWSILLATLVVTAASGTCTGAPQGVFSAAAGLGTGTPGNLFSTAQVTNSIATGVPTHANTGLFGGGGLAGSRSIPTNSAVTIDVTTGGTGAALVLQGYYVMLGTFE